MHWLTPITALSAAAVALPLLVLLYFLKLKRRERMISSTLLWKRAVQDLQVNAPFQRLRRNLLLLLQLLALLAVLAALGRPTLDLRTGPERRVVILIDRSASMNASDVGSTRLAEAKRQAKVLIESLPDPAAFSLAEGSDQTMVIAFDRRAQVMCNFTSDKRRLLEAVDSIRPADGGSSLREAMAVARAFAQPGGEETNNRSAVTPATLELFSDGRVGDLQEVEVNSGELVYHCLGESADNLGVVAMQARRSYERPERVEVFATVANSGPRAITTDVQLSLNDAVRAVRSVLVPPLRDDVPGRISVSFSLTHNGPAVVQVRQLRKDVLAADDAAWSVLQPPRKLSVLLVTGGNIALQSALGACSPARLDVKSPDEFDAMDHETLSAESTYDVILLDNHVPAALPRCRYLVFGRPPAGVQASISGQLTRQTIVDWRERHPVLQFVNLANLYVARAWKLSLPREAQVLAEFGDAPAIALLRRPDSILLLVGFDVMETNWPFEPGFVMFCQNAMNFLALEGVQNQQSVLQVGQAIQVENLPPNAAVRVRGPGAEDSNLTADSSGAARFPGTSWAGIYTVSVGDREPRHFAVNVLDAAESDVRPVREIRLATEKVETQSGPVRPSNVELWPMLALLGLALVCAEWLVYNSRVRL